MTILTDYHTEDELATALKKRLGFGSIRMLRYWRARRIGPPWAYLGRVPIYPNDRFDAWLRSQVQEPVRSRRAREQQSEAIA